MDERPKKFRGPLLWLAARTWRFWAAAAVLVPVFYILSHGPWWAIRGYKPHPLFCEVGDVFYSPIWRLYYAGMISDESMNVFMDYNAWWYSIGGGPPGPVLEPILHLDNNP